VDKGGGAVTVYLDLVMGLNFVVDFLLLIAANRLYGLPPRPGRAAVAAMLGGVYGGICMLPGFAFLGNTLWRLVCLGSMAVLAYGWSRSTLRRGLLFVLLSMALGGIVLGMGRSGFASIAAGAGGICLMCLIGFRGRITGREFAAVRIRYGGHTRDLTALKDTGNTLRDPVTGEPVLVVGADIAREMLGLTEEELRSPVAAVENQLIPGLRLIPYRAVGQPCGMLLALRMDEVMVGKERAGRVVAFAPQELGRGEEYQALAGGVL